MATTDSKPRKVRGILIDPHERTVAEVMTTAELEAWYALIGCRLVEVVRLGEVESDPDVMQDLWIDEEGMLVPWERQAFFVLKSPEDRPPLYYAQHSIAGKALLLGSIGSHSVGTGLDVELVRESIAWLSPEQVVARKPMVWQVDEHLRPIPGTGVVADGTDEPTWDIHSQPSGAKS